MVALKPKKLKEMVVVSEQLGNFGSRSERGERELIYCSGACD
jgi:hypothetical protein